MYVHSMTQPSPHSSALQEEGGGDINRVDYFILIPFSAGISHKSNELICRIKTNIFFWKLTLNKIIFTTAQCWGSGSIESVSFPWIRIRIKKWLDPDPTRPLKT